jgi:PKD repeat protein
VQPPSQNLTLDLAGTATDDLGVDEVRLVLKDLDTSKYLQPDGTSKSGYASVGATLADLDPLNPTPTSKTWSKSVTLPHQGNWNVTAYAVDTVDQRDLSTAGATARYPIYPGDTPPAFNLNLLSPDGTTDNRTVFENGQIFVSGRAEDDQAMAKVEVAIIDSAGKYLSSSGTFGNESWRTAFLTSPGTVGSNYSYTTPVVPPGDYTVKVRGTDQHDLVTTDQPTSYVTVQHPPGNTPPAAIQAEPVCPAAGQPSNVCQFDARTSTDENATTLTYAWNFGNGTGTGPNPKRTYTAPGTYTVTLTATDEWGVASAPVTKTVTIDEPAGNVAPTPVINLPNCAGLTCNFSAVGTVDPNTGDSISYTWNFGDPDTGLNNGRTGSSGSHAFSAPGEYTVSLTATDGWGKTATVTRNVTVTAPSP